MNFKLIRGFSIKGLELNTKEIISPKLEKKNLLKKKSTNLIKKNNSNLKNNDWPDRRNLNFHNFPHNHLNPH